jgi:hypothetical protein
MQTAAVLGAMGANPEIVETTVAVAVAVPVTTLVRVVVTKVDTELTSVVVRVAVRVDTFNFVLVTRRVDVAGASVFETMLVTIVVAVRVVTRVDTTMLVPGRVLVRPTDRGMPLSVMVMRDDFVVRSSVSPKQTPYLA